MRLCLVEDLTACALEPLTLTRPVHELTLGATTLASKIARSLGVGPGPQRRSCFIRSHLVDVQRLRDPHMIVNDRDWLARGQVIVANARWVPPAGFVLPDEFGPWVGLLPRWPASSTWIRLPGRRRWTPSRSVSIRGLSGHGNARPSGSLGNGSRTSLGPLLPRMQHTWSARLRGGYGKVGVSQSYSGEAGSSRAGRSAVDSTRRLHRSLLRSSIPATGRSCWARTCGSNRSRESRDPVLSALTSQLLPCRSFAVPSPIGPPSCRIGSEVEAARSSTAIPTSIYEGFLGQVPYRRMGQLAARSHRTATSRNDYGEVFVPLQGDPVPTGQAKVGCFIGDQVRGPGWGACSTRARPHRGDVQHLAGWDLLLPNHVPSFTAIVCGGSPGLSPPLRAALRDRADLTRATKTFGEAEEHLYATLHEQTRLERERAFQRAAIRHYDRTARRPGHARCGGHPNAFQLAASAGPIRRRRPVSETRGRCLGYDSAWKTLS